MAVPLDWRTLISGCLLDLGGFDMKPRRRLVAIYKLFRMAFLSLEALHFLQLNQMVGALLFKKREENGDGSLMGCCPSISLICDNGGVASFFLSFSIFFFFPR
jgi:hypothetical protein